MSAQRSAFAYVIVALVGMFIGLEITPEPRPAKPEIRYVLVPFCGGELDPAAPQGSDAGPDEKEQITL